MIRKSVVLLCILTLSSLNCCDTEKSIAPPLPQRAYVWQRDWEKPVVDAIVRSREDLTGHVVLACEIEWKNGRPKPIFPDVDWAALRDGKKSVSPAIRVMPYSGPFSEDDETIKLFCKVACQRLSIMREAGLEPRELQFDFDCAQKKLAGYRKWVRAMRRAIAPLPLVLTTLPSWLGEKEFPGLVREASSYVLQVHSVFTPAGGQTMVCDPALARKWVALASAVGVPFEIALPTYRSIVGYDAEGHKIGVYSDAVIPAWPPGTSIIEFNTDLEAMATLVASWQASRPAHCTGLIWYRLPVDGERQNCSWPAFRAITQGRPPLRACSVQVNGQEHDGKSLLTLADLSLINTGESDEFPLCSIVVKWDPPAHLIIAEPPPGWRMTQDDQQLTFISPHPLVRLPLGSSRAMGWMRISQPAQIYVNVIHQVH